MDIAEKIQNLMDEKGITAYKLAKDTGVSYTGITKILNQQTKNPQIDSLKLIADYFEKPIDYFFDREKMVDKTEGEFDEEVSFIARELKNLDDRDKEFVMQMIKTMGKGKK